MSVQTLPVIEIESGEDQRLLSQDTGVANDGFIENVGFVSGLPRFEDQLGPGESNLDDNDPDPTDPGPSGPAPSLGINITSPVNNQAFYFPVSQQGGKITAKGQVASDAYIVQSVDVKFGDSGFLPATFTYDPSTDSYDWKCTSNKITAIAELELTIVARVTGKKSSGSVNTKTASKKVKIKITDDIRPTVTINKPLPVTPLAPVEIKDDDGDGVFTVTVEGVAADNTNQLDRVEISLNGEKPIILNQNPSNWTANFTLSFKTIPHDISVCAFDKEKNSSETQHLFVKTIDDKPATLQITAPEGSVVELPLVDGAAGVVLPRLEGSAKDLQSGVKKVEWGVGENPQFLPANQDASNWSKWNVKNIFIPGPVGPKNIRVRCLNGSGLFTVKDLNIAVTELYPPRNPTVQEYLSNLIDFIVRRVVKTTGVNTTAPLKVEDLTATLYQPFQSLLGEDKALQSQQVHQLRICIEILRKHLAKTASVTPGPLVAQATAVLQSAESKYRQRVYESMLNRLGVSFEELRLIRLLDAQGCRALAQRMGFDFSLRTVDGTAPENPLEQFLLQPGQFTEAELETLFGLMDTTRDPLQIRDFNPILLELQLQRLEEVWTEQDDEAGRPVIDPDVIGEADLYPGVNPAYSLWQVRQTWVKNQLKIFRDQLTHLPPTKGASAFDQVVSGALGPIRDLQALESQLEAGADVEDRLSEMQLTLPAFIRLMKLRKLADAGALLGLEVDDVASILTQVMKVRSFADWRKEEQEAELVLGPDFFRLPTDQETVVAPDVSPEWRVGADSRRLWQDTLQARIDQRKSLRQALLSVIDAAEEDSLPLLRDGLVQAMAKLSPLFDADALSRQFLVDIKTSGFQKITRVEQAIQTLQNLLIDLRTNKLSLPWSLNTTNESQEELDEELRWMGAYANWYSAMQVFLFPENLLLPTVP